MAITVLKNNVPWGPFTRAQIEDGLSRGDFTLKYLAHAPGLKEWLPLGEVLHFLDVGVSPPPVPPPQNLPPVPSAEMLKASNPPTIPRPISTQPVETKRGPEIATAPVPPALPRFEVQLTPAPFFARTMAFLLDCAILFLPIFALFGLSALIMELQGLWQHTDAETMHQQWQLQRQHLHRLLLLVAVGLGWFYGAGLESSRWQATVGKRWMGLKVTDAHGERLGFLRATGRHAAKYLSALTCFFGFIMALFSSRGMALHDRLADTRVVRK